MRRTGRWVAGAALGLTLAPLPALAQTAHGGGQGPVRDGYPKEIARRPLTLPAGTVQLSSALDIEHVQLVSFDPVTMTSTTQAATNALLAIGAAYGATDDLELDFGATTAGVPYPSTPLLPGALTLGPGSLAGGTTLGLHSSLPNQPFLQETANLGFTDSLVRGTDGPLALAPSVELLGDFDQSGGRPWMWGVAAGASTRYRLGPRLYLLGLDNLVDVYLHPAGAAKFVNLPVGAGYQLAPDLALQAGTSVAVIRLAGPVASEWLLKDFVPLDLMAIYATDVGLDGVLAFDFTHFSPAGTPLDFWDVVLGINYRL